MRRQLLNAEDRTSIAGNSIAKSYILQAKILVNGRINFAEAADYYQWHDMSLLNGVIVPRQFTKVRFLCGWLVANIPDDAIQSSNFILIDNWLPHKWDKTKTIQY